MGVLRDLRSSRTVGRDVQGFGGFAHRAPGLFKSVSRVVGLKMGHPRQKARAVGKEWPGSASMSPFGKESRAKWARSGSADESERERRARLGHPKPLPAIFFCVLADGEAACYAPRYEAAFGVSHSCPWVRTGRNRDFRNTWGRAEVGSEEACASCIPTPTLGDVLLPERQRRSGGRRKSVHCTRTLGTGHKLEAVPRGGHHQ